MAFVAEAASLDWDWVGSHESQEPAGSSHTVAEGLLVGGLKLRHAGSLQALPQTVLRLVLRPTREENGVVFHCCARLGDSAISRSGGNGLRAGSCKAFATGGTSCEEFGGNVGEACKGAKICICQPEGPGQHLACRKADAEAFGL